ncbi:uncharacterized protein LODBEIA_P43720 [Lodderomyces beijingensis]|uniref:PCI domain-containing protein n=1 Tax=Lodderomyces beijingensis TaxID=1775926 RepID=A0ABP0ZPQ9_9ASCO
MASVIVVDNDLKDSIQEYAQIIDGVTGTSEFSKSIDSHIPKTLDQQLSNKPELFNKIQKVSTAENLRKLTDKEFEPTIYLLIHILSALTSTDSVLNNAQSPIYHLILTINPTQPLSLRDRKSIKSSTVLSILSTIFNLLPKDSKVRIYVVQEILKVIKTSGVEFSSIQDNVGSNLVNWLNLSNAQESEIKSIFWDFIALDPLYSLTSLKLIKDFTHRYTVAEQELAKLIEFALRSKVVDVSFLVNNNVAKALHASSTTGLSQLFLKYVKGETIQAQGVPSDLPQEFIHQKSRILSLAKFFADSKQSSSHDDIVFSYKEIPLVSSHLEFEKLLVEAIKAGVVEGKLNQIDETFSLSRVNRFIIAGDDAVIAQEWENVKVALQQWSQSISNIDEIVRQTRENIVNGGAN